MRELRMYLISSNCSICNGTQTQVYDDSRMMLYPACALGQGHIRQYVENDITFDGLSPFFYNYITYLYVQVRVCRRIFNFSIFAPT